MVKKEYNTSIKVVDLGTVNVKFTMAMAKDSASAFMLGRDIEKSTGLSMIDAKNSNETEDDAYFMGLTNVMNDNQDIFFFSNATRIKGNAKKNGFDNAKFEQILHEVFHLSMLIVAKHFNKGARNWAIMKWPSIGEGGEIAEESFADLQGQIGLMIGDDFVRMYKKLMG
jgi:hypothetical protein